MNETSGQSSYSIGGNKQFESPEWVVMKSVIDSQMQLSQILEQQALYTCRDEPELDDEEMNHEGVRQMFTYYKRALGWALEEEQM